MAFHYSSPKATRDLPNPGTEPQPPALQADSSSSEPLGNPQEDNYSSETNHNHLYFA